MNDRTTLSLCMIVKNEEEFLPACLRSVQECVDEMIIVDTGSTDRTPEIAASFGARIYSHPWENNFSKHRNQSIRYARGDWILWMDADEALEPGGGQVIRKAMTAEGIDSLLVTMVCFFSNRTRQSWNNSVKLFKNHCGIHFEGAVHNQVVETRNTVFCPVKIYHYGYDVGLHQARKKFERTSRLLESAILKDPENFRHHHDLAVSYAGVRMYRKAMDEGLMAIRLYHGHRNEDPNILWTHFVVASSCFNLGLLKQAREVSEAALRIGPDHVDSHFVLASVYAAENNRSNFERAYGRYVEFCAKFKENPGLLAELVVNKIDEKWRLDLDFGSLLLKEGDEKRARELLQSGIAESPDPAAACMTAVHSCRQARRLTLAEESIEWALRYGTDRRIVTFEMALLAKASGKQANYESKMEELLTAAPEDRPEFLAAVGTEALKLPRYQEAESLLMQALNGGYETPAVFTSLALACKYQGKTAQAKEWNLKALEMDVMDTRACVNLGHLSYEHKNWKEASSWYNRALETDGIQKDVLLRLSLISLIEHDLSACVDYCDRLSRAFKIPLDMEIGSVKDLSVVYQAIGDAFLKNGYPALHKEAASFACSLGCLES